MREAKIGNSPPDQQIKRGHALSLMFCLRRIDVGVAASHVVGKQLLSMSAALGSSSVAVAAQNKRWTFVGHGVALGDQVKWIDSTATSDDNCNDWDAQEIDVDGVDGDSSTTNIVFAEGSELTGPLQLCYRFSTGDHPFKLYPAITVDVYEVYSVLAAEEGSKSLSVAEYTKVLTLSGFGTAEFDEARWLLEGSTDCSSASYVVPLTSGGDGGDNSALVTSSFQASFEFTKEVFTQTATGSASASATLCYKFGSEEFQHYPSISMGIHYLNGWTSAVGSSSVAVVGVPEDLTFTGYGISENNLSLDRARWVMSGASCAENTARISDTAATDNQVDVVDGQATFTFMSSTSGETPALCYWFQDEPGVYLSSLTIDVAYLSSLSAPNFGDDDVAVVGYPKSWRFAGGHIESGDFVRWIYDESSDCSDTSSVPEVQEDGEILSGETTFTFAETVSGRWVTPCYRCVVGKVARCLRVANGYPRVAPCQQPRWVHLRPSGRFLHESILAMRRGEGRMRRLSPHVCDRSFRALQVVGRKFSLTSHALDLRTRRTKMNVLGNKLFRLCSLHTFDVRMMKAATRGDRDGRTCLEEAD